MMRLVVVVVLSVAASVVWADFQVPENKVVWEVTEGFRKCFFESVPSNTLISVHYKNLDAGVPTNLNAADTSPLLQVSVQEPMGAFLHSEMMLRENTFRVTGHDEGEHRICVAVQSSNNWFGNARKFKFELYIDSGDKAIDWAEMAKVEHLTAIEVEVRKLADVTRGIRKEQTYQRHREAQFRDTSESTNARVAWWSLFTTCLVIGLGIWQVFYLKSFFKKKKLV